MEMRKVAYSGRIDVQVYGYFRFTLEALENRRDDIEISVEYGPSLKKRGAMTANVWARTPGGAVKTFLFAQDVDSSDYGEIASAIYRSPDFQPALLAFIEGRLEK